MKLLICAQAVDTGDTALGFFHRWLEELASHYESIAVLCLREGEYHLPANVRVIHLGSSRFMRAARLLREALRLRGEYGAVFVHQGEEFVLVSGWLWSLLRKPVYLWRNHYQGSILTSVAAAFCKKVFYTSNASYTARYRNAVKMPVGVDLGLFSPGEAPPPSSVLSLGRIAPSKRVDLLLEALGALAQKRLSFSASLYGGALPKDAAYADALKTQAHSLGLDEKVRFYGGLPHDRTPAVYRAHEIFVNISQSGMYDKTIFEAAASGCLVLTSIEDFKTDGGEEYFFADKEELARKLEIMLALPDAQKQAHRATLRAVAERHSLSALGRKLASELS